MELEKEEKKEEEEEEEKLGKKRKEGRGKMKEHGILPNLLD